MAKLYANENFYLPVVQRLREQGHDVLTTGEAGQANRKIPDEAVLAYAIQENRILLTFNRKHFIRLHRINPAHTGIIVCTEDPDFAALAERIHQALTTNITLDGQLIRIYRPQQ